MNPSETTERLRRSREAAEMQAEVREAKEDEADPELKAAAAMERADFLTKEVKQGKQQMQNILMHMSQVTTAIAQLRAQLNLQQSDDASSVAHDKKRVQDLQQKIAVYQDELVNMRHDLIREEMNELQKGVGVGMTTAQLEQRAEERVDAMIGMAQPKNGFTLIEIMVAIAVFLVFAMGIYGGVQYVFQLVFQSRVRMIEVGVASEEMEIIRHLSYEDIGFTTGTPTGILERSTTLTDGGIDVLVRRTVRFVDDPFDGTSGGNPDDTEPDDYKFVQIDATCVACDQAEPVTLSTYVAP